MSKPVAVSVKTDKESAGIFVNAAGHNFPIRGLSPMLPDLIRQGLEEEWKKTEELPSKPTYTVPTITGEPEVHEHNEGSLQTDEDKAAWEKYVLKRDEFDKKLNERVMKAVFLRGVMLTIPDIEAWISEMKAMGISVPEDAAERRYLYVRTEVIQSVEDVGNLMIAVLRLSGTINEEAVAAAEAAFRSATQEALAIKPEVIAK